jgi:hypothetical protein
VEHLRSLPEEEIMNRILRGAVFFVGSLLMGALPHATGQESDPQVKVEVPSEPPAPGPDLLKYTPEQIEAAYAGKTMPEAVSMYLVIARGGQLDGRSGWFKPAQSRYSWAWLAERHQVEPDQGIPKDKFHGSEAMFSRLDRDRDGVIKASDLDWSDNNPWVMQSSMITRVFRRMDMGGDGRLSRTELEKFFEQAAGGGEDLLVSSSPVPDAPSKETLIKGLMEGEIGSLQEGPAVGDKAPDFELKPLQGGKPVRLSEQLGKKPVVLVFGNFTCGPFRFTYQAVESVHRRHKDDANFLLVYVREAHPTDGWSMTSNERLGVSVAQPKSYEERNAVAQQCAARLNPAMPLLVDEIDDRTGNAYSGMPARLYVIAPDGTVVYKSGRGPFGFKPEEMEQALVMLQLDSSLNKHP